MESEKIVGGRGSGTHTVKRAVIAITPSSVRVIDSVAGKYSIGRGAVIDMALRITGGIYSLQNEMESAKSNRGGYTVIVTPDIPNTASENSQVYADIDGADCAVLNAIMRFRCIDVDNAFAVICKALECLA